MEEIIEKQEAAKNKDFYPRSSQVGRTLQLDGDIGSYTIPVYLVNKDGTDGLPATDDLGNAIEFSALNTNILVTGRMSLRLKKPVTTGNAAGINLA